MDPVKASVNNICSAYSESNLNTLIEEFGNNGTINNRNSKYRRPKLLDTKPRNPIAESSSIAIFFISSLI